MNLLDYLILTTLAVFVVAGIHNGFLVSLLNNAAYLVSLVGAYIFHPMLSTYLMKQVDLFSNIVYYAEGEEKLARLDQARIPVQNLDFDALTKIVDNSKVPQPIDSLIVSNVQNQTFASEGITTVGGYYNNTIACFVVNVFAFILLFAIIKVVLGFFIHGTDYVVRLPVLRQFDGLLGGAMGFLQGVLILFVVFIVIPAGIVLMPASQNASASSNLITDYVDASRLSSVFYPHNFILSMIKGFF